ncbi:MAG: hypothetical protein JNM80_04515 [Phycisphaerae bacterium]|nr:hypothetical protein [Phycisphaerae bacterium]
MRTRPSALLLSLLLAGPAFAQTDADAARPRTPSADQPGAVQPATPAPPREVGFETLAQRGPDGKVRRVSGILDILAMKRNLLLDDAARAKLRPVLLNWLADVDQIAIDNLDFLEKIEPPAGGQGVIDKLNLEDMPSVHAVAQMMSQLMSAGPLTNHCEQKGAFTPEQSSQNQRIVSDYLQAVMNEIMAEAGRPNDLSVQAPADAQKASANAVSRFLYGVSSRDAMYQYHRLMADAAVNIDPVVASLGLSGPVADKVKGLVPAAKSATTFHDRRKAVRAILNELSFDQRRALLQKARELKPITDPFEMEMY